MVLLKTLANARSGLVRMSSYLGLVNFLILFGIALKWLHSVIASNILIVVWMIGGYAITILLIGIAAWIDRKYIWPREFGIVNKANPMMEIQVLHAAILLEQIDNPETRDKIISALDSSGHLERLNEYHKALTEKQC